MLYDLVLPNHWQYIETNRTHFAIFFNLMWICSFIWALNQYSRSVERFDGDDDVWLVNRSFGMDHMDWYLVIVHDVHSYIYHTDCHSLLYDDVAHGDDGDGDKTARNYWNRPNTVGLWYAKPCHLSYCAMLDFGSFARVLLWLPTVVAVPYCSSHYSVHPIAFDYMLFGLLFHRLKSIKLEICVPINK